MQLCTTTKENQPFVTKTTASVVILLPNHDELALLEEQIVVAFLQEAWVHVGSDSDGMLQAVLCGACDSCS